MRRPHPTESRWILACATALALTGGLAIAAAPDKPQIREQGFRLRHFDNCGYAPWVPNVAPNLPKYITIDRYAIGDIECSPGPAWGDYVFLAIAGRDLGADLEGWASRIDMKGNFAGSAAFTREENAYEIAFAPPGWRGGDFFLLASNAKHAIDPLFDHSLIQSVDPARNQDGLVWRYGSDVRLGPLAVDPSGGFGGDAFFVEPGAGIIRIDASGAESFFAPEIPGDEMRFGPGGAWGTDLYIGGVTIDPSGGITASPASFDEFDWAFDGDMFALVPGSPAEIYRVKPDGTRTLFATATASELAYCGGSLWLAGTDGCWVVTPTGPGN